MSAEDTLKLISKQWCSITDLMKLLGCGRNKVLEVKNIIKISYYIKVIISREITYLCKKS